MSIKDKKSGVVIYFKEIQEEFLKERRKIEVQDKIEGVSQRHRGLNRQTVLR